MVLFELDEVSNPLFDDTSVLATVDRNLYGKHHGNPRNGCTVGEWPQPFEPRTVGIVRWPLCSPPSIKLPRPSSSPESWGFSRLVVVYFVILHNRVNWINSFNMFRDSFLKTSFLFVRSLGFVFLFLFNTLRQLINIMISYEMRFKPEDSGTCSVIILTIKYFPYQN